MKDLGIIFKKGTQLLHPRQRKVKKLYEVLFSLWLNVAYNDETLIKLSLYKSLVLPTVTCGLSGAKLSEGTMNAVEMLRKIVVKWIIGKYTGYANNSSPLNTLLLPIFVQMIDLLLSSLIKRNLADVLNRHVKTTCSVRRPLTYEIETSRTKRSRSEVFSSNCRVVNKAKNFETLRAATELVSKTILCEIWMHSNKQLDENISYIEIWVCDYGQCTNMGQRL